MDHLHQRCRGSSAGRVTTFPSPFEFAMLHCMKTLAKLGATVAVAGFCTAFLPTEANAATSTRDPLYVGGTVLGFGAPLNSGYRGPTPYRLDFDFGGHINGRHDGFVIGFRQAFLFGGGFDGGITQMRLGGDIAIPIRGGRMELTIAPYGAAGIYYNFNGGAGTPRAAISFGVEGKFFPIEGNGFFAMARPFEITIMPGSGITPVLYGFGVGAGYAF